MRTFERSFPLRAASRPPACGTATRISPSRSAGRFSLGSVGVGVTGVPGFLVAPVEPSVCGSFFSSVFSVLGVSVLQAVNVAEVSRAIAKRGRSFL